MVGLSKSFKLLATTGGPTESSYNYAMEEKKRQGKLDQMEGERKKGEHFSKRMETAGMGKPATVK